MNTDIRVSVSFRGHHKRKRLERILGPGASGWLLDLWIATAMNHPSGHLHGLDATDLALKAGYDGDPDTFVQALAECGFLDLGEHGYCLHDWAEHQAWAVHAPARSLRAKNAAAARWKAKAGQAACDPDASLDPEPDPDCNPDYDPDYAPDYDPRYDSHYDPDYEPGYELGPPHSDHALSNAPTPSPDPDPDPAPTALTSPAGEAGTAPVSGLTGKKPGSRPDCPPCPQQELVALYQQILPELPKVKLWTATRARLLRTLWRTRFVAGKFTDQATGLRYFQNYFEYVRESPFLLGQTGNSDKSFCADLEWLLRPGNFAKVIEGRYHGRNQG